MKKYVVISMLVISLVVLSQVANAIPKWNVNFDGMTVGNPPTTLTPAISGAVNTMPTAVSSSGTGSILVDEDFTPGEITMPGNSLVMNTGFTGGYNDVYFTGNSDDYQIGQNFQLDYDMMITNSKGWCFGTELWRNGTSNPVALFAIYAGDNRVLMASYEGSTSTSSYFWPDGNWSWSNDVLLHVTLLYDAQNNLFNAKINGNQVGSIPLAQSEGNQDVRTIHFYESGSSAVNMRVALDNIVTTPEPATMALLGLGAICLRRRK